MNILPSMDNIFAVKVQEPTNKINKYIILSLFTSHDIEAWRQDGKGFVYYIKGLKNLKKFEKTIKAFDIEYELITK